MYTGYYLYKNISSLILEENETKKKKEKMKTKKIIIKRQFNSLRIEGCFKAHNKEKSLSTKNKEIKALKL